MARVAHLDVPPPPKPAETPERDGRRLLQFPPPPPTARPRPAAELPPPRPPASAEIVVLRQERRQSFMLAPRLASASALNPPKALAPARSKTRSAMKPIPRRDVEAGRSAPKPQRRVTPPRVLKTSRPTAEVIRLTDLKPVRAGARRAA